MTNASTSVSRIIVMTSVLLLGGMAAIAQNVSLTVTGMRSKKGDLCVSVFKDNQSFKDNKPSTRLKFAKSAAQGGNMRINLTLPPGTYGIAMLDDENGNGKMDNNMVGMPKEGFGFSNFYLSGLSRPSFDDFRFEVKSSPVTLNGKLRFL